MHHAVAHLRDAPGLEVGNHPYAKYLVNLIASVLTNHCKDQEEAATHIMPHAKIMPGLELDIVTLTFAKKEQVGERVFSVMFG